MTSFATFLEFKCSSIFVLLIVHCVSFGSVAILLLLSLHLHLFLFPFRPQPSCHPTAGGSATLPTLSDPPTIFFSSIPERPISFSPPPTGPPKAYNTQRRKSTSILEAHTRHFQPAYPRYGSSLHPFAGVEGVDTPSFFMHNPGFATAAQRLGVGEHPHPGGTGGSGEETEFKPSGLTGPLRSHGVRRLPDDRAPARAFEFPSAEASGYESGPQAGFFHSHIMQRLNAHSPIPPPVPSMSQAAGCPLSCPSSDAQHHASPSTYAMSTPPVMADAPPPPSPGSVFDYHLAAAAAAAASDPSLLASRLYRARRSSMDLPLEENTPTGSSGSGSYLRLQPVTEEMCSYVSPELPLPPGSLLLHHAGFSAKDRSPEPSSDSLPSSDAGEFQSPPPSSRHFDPSAARSIPQSSSAAFCDLTESQAHPPSMQSFLPPSPATEPGVSAPQQESLIPSAWARHGGVVPSQADMTYHESLLAMQANNAALVLSSHFQRSPSRKAMGPIALLQYCCLTNCHELKGLFFFCQQGPAVLFQSPSTSRRSSKFLLFKIQTGDDCLMNIVNSSCKRAIR
uniref:Uncharacterized protein n=1 Tax=Hippocampus comes TaxID=109280 RepID=A0A3Q2Y2W8_HIPCM